MSDPKGQQREPDEFELDSETIRDLDVPSDDAGEVLGAEQRPDVPHPLVAAEVKRR